jgi:hypothetical protein
MNFTAFIAGNRYGMVNLVYHEPLLLGMNARFHINNKNKNVYNLSLTKIISRISPEKMMIWDSVLFQKFPRATEIFVRLLMNGVTGRFLQVILNRVNPGIPMTFKMFPFSTDPMYEKVNFTADDGSGMRHQSVKGNLWFSCNCPTCGECNITIEFPRK